MSDTELDVSSIESLEADPRPVEPELEVELSGEEEELEAETGEEEEEATGSWVLDIQEMSPDGVTRIIFSYHLMPWPGFKPTSVELRVALITPLRKRVTCKYQPVFLQPSTKRQGIP